MHVNDMILIRCVSSSLLKTSQAARPEKRECNLGRSSKSQNRKTAHFYLCIWHTIVFTQIASRKAEPSEIGEWEQFAEHTVPLATAGWA